MKRASYFISWIWLILAIKLSIGIENRAVGSKSVNSRILQPDNAFQQQNESQNTNNWEKKKRSVADALKHAWDNYDKNCFGIDQYHPVTKECITWMGAGLTIIDSLDTLKLMGFETEYTKGRNWVENLLKLQPTFPVSLFETNIRILGGLLSAYDLSDDDMFLKKAKEVADVLDVAFPKSSDNILFLGTGIPKAKFNFNSSFSGQSSLADIGTLQLEHFVLSHHLGDNQYHDKTQRLIDYLDGYQTNLIGLYPSLVNSDQLFGEISLGAGGDSFYEYLLKSWLLTGRSNDQCRRMYVESSNSIVKNMITKNEKNMVYLPNLDSNGEKKSTMEHLTCFASGMLALGSVSGILPTKLMEAEHMQIAKDLGHTCYELYASTATGLGPEDASFLQFNMTAKDPRYQLRPETIESIFYLWRITKNEMYRKWGWNIFLALEKHCKLKSGYSGIRDVNNAINHQYLDKQESFFLAETLKYMWLLFQDPSNFPLAGIDDQHGKKKGVFYVFNTEAHPFKIW